MKTRVVMGRTFDAEPAQVEEIGRMLGGLAVGNARGETWYVKLNLTYPSPAPGVVSSAETASALASWAADRQIRLTFVESDGGNHSHRASEALAACGFVDIARRFGGSVKSLTDERWIPRPMSAGGREFELELPESLLERRFDRLVDMAVIKTHIFTTVSLGIKNLWGCIPNPLRMYHHHLLDHGIVGLAKELRPDLLILDGRTALDGNGPIDGRPVPARTLVVADSVGAGDWATAKAMGFAPTRIAHLRLARAEGLVPDAEIVGELPETFPRTFRMERTLYNRLSMIANLSPRLQKLVYHSPLSKYVYAIVRPLRWGKRSGAISRRGANAGYGG